MTETDRRIQCVMAALNYLRSQHLIPADAVVSHGAMEELSHRIGQPVSKATFQRLEITALEKLRHSPEARLALQALKRSRQP